MSDESDAKSLAPLFVRITGETTVEERQHEPIAPGRAPDDEAAAYKRYHDSIATHEALSDAISLDPAD